MEYEYYIGCDLPPSTTTNGIWNRCRVTESEVLTQEQVSLIYSPALTFTEANEIGLQVFIVWGLIYVAKRKARLFQGKT